MLLSFPLWLDNRMGLKSPGGIAALLRGECRSMTNC